MIVRLKGGANVHSFVGKDATEQSGRTETLTSGKVRSRLRRLRQQARHAAIVQREKALIYRLLAGRFAVDSPHRLLLHMLARSAMRRMRKLDALLDELPGTDITAGETTVVRLEILVRATRSAQVGTFAAQALERVIMNPTGWPLLPPLNGIDDARQSRRCSLERYSHVIPVLIALVLNVGKRKRCSDRNFNQSRSRNFFVPGRASKVPAMKQGTTRTSVPATSMPRLRHNSLH